MSPPTRRSPRRRTEDPNVDWSGDLHIVTAEAANRAELCRRLACVARDADRRGHHDEAAIARWFLAGAA